MSNPYFEFKQFKVFHDKSSMKVGTDAVLLACLAHYKKVENILEIGCGSGVISLMAAQLSKASITAIDIHEASVKQAKYNFDSSPWVNRLRAETSSLQSFVNKTNMEFNLLISNPPFFIDSLKSTKDNRNLARHNDNLSQTDLLKSARQLLKPTGTLALILPLTEGETLILKAKEEGFYLKSKVDIVPKPSKKANRMVIELGRNPQEYSQKELTIREENNDYTFAYKELTKDFYLAL